MQFLSESYELPKLILDFRSLNKLKTGYTDKLPLQISNKTGRVHTSYQQAITATGRLSSTEPNLQNIPIKSSQGKKIRNAFVAEQGKKIFAADYSQIELRIMAHLSGDDGLRIVTQVIAGATTYLQEHGILVLHDAWGSCQPDPLLLCWTQGW